MMLQTALIALLLQAATARASISGVAINAATGEPAANVRVALAHTEPSLGAFAQMTSGRGPQTEETLSGDVLRVMVGQLEAAAAAGNAPAELVARAAALKSLPVGDIHELIASPTGDVAAVYKSSPPVLTDERGRFAFSNVAPGRYKLLFSGNGYARQDYGQRAAGTGGVPIVLVAGESKTDIVMRLPAVAAIGGRIRDAEGEALAGVPVQLFRFTYDSMGQKKVQRVAAVLSDDRGEYRMFYLSPGSYYLSAGHQAGQRDGRGQQGLDAILFGEGYASVNRIEQTYALSYYPGVPDENSARVIDLPSGADVRGIDMLVSPQQTYRISGRITDSRTNSTREPIMLILRAQTSELSTRTSGFTETAPDGTFEMRGVTPGTYLLSASVADRNQALGVSASAAAIVTVVNADIIGINATMGVPSVIPGRVRVEGPPSTSPSLGLMRVELRTPGASLTTYYQETPRLQTVEGGAVFRVENVLPGDYRVHIFGVPAGFYVKEARFGTADVLNEPLRLGVPDASRTIDILLNSNVGSLTGVAADAAGQPVPGAQVVLIPNSNRQRTELFRPVTADSSGRFSITAIVPGEYTLAAWEAHEPFAFFDPVLIRQAEGSGKSVRVGESSNQTVNVTAMPAGR